MIVLEMSCNVLISDGPLMNWRLVMCAPPSPQDRWERLQQVQEGKWVNVNPGIGTVPPAGLVLDLYNRIPAQPHHTSTCMSSPLMQLIAQPPCLLFSLSDVIGLLGNSIHCIL